MFTLFTIYRFRHKDISPISAFPLLAVVTLWRRVGALRRVGTRWGIRARGRVCTTLGVTCRRVSSWWITLSRRSRRIATIRLTVCWLLWCVPNRRWNRLIDARHLLHWRHCHGLWAELPISLVHFNFVLGLHTGANRAVDHIRQAGKDLGSLWKLFTTNNSGNYREDTSNLLEAEHEANDAVIAFSCLYVEFILEQEAGWSNWITKAQKHLSSKTELWASAFTTLPTAWHVPSTADISWHVIIQSPFAKHVWHTWSTEQKGGNVKDQILGKKLTFLNANSAYSKTPQNIIVQINETRLRLNAMPVEKQSTQKTKIFFVDSYWW